MIIDNIDKILPFLIFDNEDDFYYLQILKRKKENKELGSNSRVIKNYYINSQEYLKSHYDEIKELCTQFNARASMRLNKRSYESVAFKCLENIANSMRNREYKFIKASYDRACGLGHNDKNKKWILDIDKEDLVNLKLIKKDLITLSEKDIILAELESKSGIHLITKPFNSFVFSAIHKIEIHKDNPTNLYIP